MHTILIKWRWSQIKIEQPALISYSRTNSTKSLNWWLNVQKQVYPLTKINRTFLCTVRLVGFSTTYQGTRGLLCAFIGQICPKIYKSKISWILPPPKGNHMKGLFISTFGKHLITSNRYWPPPNAINHLPLVPAANSR